MFKFLGITGLVLATVGCGGGGSASQSKAVNLAPSIPDMGALSVREGSTTVVSINATDGNADKLTYTISGGDDGSIFTISSSGDLSFLRAPDFELPGDTDADNVYSVSVQVSDGSLSDTQEMTVSVVDAFEGRVAIAPMAGAAVYVDLNANGSQDENEPAGTTDSNGFFWLASFELTEDSAARVVSVGGTDTITGQLLPQLALTAEVPGDKGEAAHVTPLTTLLASMDDAESKAKLLAALAIAGSPLELLTRDGWRDFAAGDPQAVFRHRVDRQMALLQQAALEFVTSSTGFANQSLSLVRAVAHQAAQIIDVEGGLDLTSAVVIEDLLKGAFGRIAPEIQSDEATLDALAESVAMVNAVIADPAVDLRSDTAIEIVGTAQGAFLKVVSELAEGRASIASFSEQTEPKYLFQGVELPLDAPDRDLDGIADAIDPDNDGDGVNDGLDKFPEDLSESYDTDEDGVGDNADLDDDNDGIEDNNDAFALIPVGSSADRDQDGWLDDCALSCLEAGMTADPDDDNDGVTDVNDAYPHIALGQRIDTDNDGRPNECDALCQVSGMSADPDDDNDGVSDDADSMPLNKHVHTMPTTAPQYLDLELLPKTLNTLTGVLTSTSQDDRPVTFSIATQAAHGNATLLDAATGAFEYSTTADSVQTDSFSYVVNDGYVDSAPSTVSLSLRTDPLYKHQWHLVNTGQQNFADIGGRVGADMNVSGAVVAGYTGKGVVLAVVDTGLEIAHEDLVDNVVPGSYDFIDADMDPTRTGNGGDHGTAVVGIAAARGWNDVGLRGVAPNASLKGYNWLMSQSTANWISTFGGEAYSEDVDIFNNSWGYAPPKIDDPLVDHEETTFYETLPAMRRGKGAIFVKSAGNYFDAHSNGVCGNSNGDGGLSCRDVNQDSTHNNPNIIVVGALNADGTRASYSTTGSALWVSAPGGETGSSSAGGKPALMSTDVQGCTKGYVGGRGDGANLFNSKSSPHAENTNCNYMSTMNGTSAAAPNVSGAIALMLEANPQLTMRDVKHILAQTSQQVDASIPPVLVDGITYHEWVTNHAGYTFHNYYGFGGIDATAAVEAAQNFPLDSLGDRSTAGWISTGTIDLHAGFGATVTQALNVPTSGIVEHVLVRLTLSHADPSETGFRLTSPSGTTTTIWQPYAAAASAVESKPVYLSASAFYGESMAGDWTLSAYDHKSGNPLTLHAYEIKIDYR